MSKFIADKRFYKMVLAIAIPIMVQNGITNFVNLLDNIMVGQIGTAQMSGVAIVNQILFVFNLCIFGACAGAGIFTAQYYGIGDMDGVRDTTRLKMIICSVMIVAGIVIMTVWNDELISLFLSEKDSPELTALTLKNAKTYMYISLIGMIPMALVQVYSSTLRETGETVVPMKAGAIAVIFNLVLNYFLIFDHFGHKGLGVAGAAIATLIARIIEAAIIIYWTHKNKEKNPYAKGMFKSLKVSPALTKSVLKKGIPLVLNETLWGLGMTTLLQCYSVRGLSVVAAMNISSVIFNVFSIVFIALGDSIAIIVGQLLGKGKMEEAKDTDNKLIFFSTAICFVIGAVLVLVAPIFPSIYKTEPEVREMATSFIRIIGFCLPIHAFLHAAYFTIRSGGKTLLTFLYDCGYMWVITVVLAYCLSRFTTINIVHIYFIVQISDLLKAAIGFILLKKNIWLNNIVNDI